MLLTVKVNIPVVQKINILHTFETISDISWLSFEAMLLFFQKFNLEMMCTELASFIWCNFIFIVTSTWITALAAWRPSNCQLIFNFWSSFDFISFSLFPFVSIKLKHNFITKITKEKKSSQDKFEFFFRIPLFLIFPPRWHFSLLISVMSCFGQEERGQSYKTENVVSLQTNDFSVIVISLTVKGYKKYMNLLQMY